MSVIADNLVRELNLDPAAGMVLKRAIDDGDVTVPEFVKVMGHALTIPPPLALGLLRQMLADNGTAETRASLARELMLAVPAGLDSLALSYANTTPWTVRSVAANQWTGVAWSPELELFAGIGYNAVAQPAMSSPDGVTWTQHNVASAQWTDLIWVPELSKFVASGQLGVLTSTDGETWTVSAFIANRFAHGLCYSPELGIFVAVGINSSPYDKFYSFTSPDGLAWTAHLAGNSVDFYPERVVWAKELGLFLATSDAGLTTDLATSPDGINWTFITTPNIGFYGIAWSPELRRAVAVSDYDNKFAWTDDGLDWTFANFPSNGLTSWVPITWAADLGLFVAVANSGTKRLATSPDGKTWTMRDMAEVPTSPSTLGWSPELGLMAFLAYGGANRAQTSDPL